MLPQYPALPTKPPRHTAGIRRQGIHFVCNLVGNLIDNAVLKPNLVSVRFDNDSVIMDGNFGGLHRLGMKHKQYAAKACYDQITQLSAIHRNVRHKTKPGKRRRFLACSPSLKIHL